MEARESHVQSVSRALKLMTILGKSSRGMRVSDLARESGLAVSTTHRLLTTLENDEFVHFDHGQREWHVGREAFAVGANYLQKRSYVAPGMGQLRRLRDATKETANLGCLEDGQLVTLGQAESREIMRAISPPGGRVPATCSAMGKALLATWPDTEIDRFITRHGFTALTARSITDPASFWSEIAEIRHSGFAVDDEEHARDLRCIGAAVLGPSGEAIAAISVSGIAQRVTRERIQTVANKVMTAASQLSLRIGGQKRL
ncbi:IclR family transcriptional regulator [Roseovarius aestuarii]|nr:IclR family transcriptional regulator [Roseovarius aestuarii]